MATIPKAAITWCRSLTGGEPVMFSFPEAASQSFSAGAPVQLNATSGKLELATVASSLVTATGSQVSGSLLGIAAAPASGTTDALCPVYLAVKENIFLANVIISGGAGTTAQTQVLDSGPFDLRESTAGSIYGVDYGSSATNSVLVLCLDPRDTAGDTNGRVQFIFNPVTSLFQQ